MQFLTWRDVFGRQMSGQVGSSRHKSGQSGRYFFWQLLSLRFCIGFSVSGVDSWFWQPLHDRHPRLSQTPDPSRSAGAWWEVCRVRTLQVGLSRAEAGRFPMNRFVTTKPYTVPVLTSPLSLPPFRIFDCVFGWRQPGCWSRTAGMRTQGR